MTVISDFNLPSGNLYVSVLIHALPCQLRTILKLMGLQRDIIGQLSSYYVVTVHLSRVLGVTILLSVSLQLMLVLLMLIRCLHLRLCMALPPHCLWIPRLS